MSRAPCPKCGDGLGPCCLGVEVELIVIPDDISYPVWATDFVYEKNAWGQRYVVELDSIRWSKNKEET